MTARTRTKTLKSSDGKSQFKVIKRPVDLRSRAGRGGLPPGAMEDAQQAALAMKDDCLDEVKSHLEEIEKVLERERFGDHDLLRKELSTLAAQVFAFCGTCGLEVVGDIAKSLDRLAVKDGQFDDADFALIEPHLHALAFAVTEFSKPDGSEDHCKTLLAGLQGAVATRLS